jgi:two-component system probable response regulator PhcQ
MSNPEGSLPMILFVDDESTAVKYFQRAVGSLAPVAIANSVEEGKRILDAHADSLRVLVSDQRMPGAYGNELLEYSKSRYPGIVRILTTAYSEIEQIVEAVNQGHIYRYLQKPWEITALRMELKQALDVANLRRDHTQLLHEKLMVRQKQLTGTRIASLHALCATLSGSANVTPLEAYLSAAQCAGVTASEPDWLLMDYADLSSAEAFRSGALGNAVSAELRAMDTKFDKASAQNWLMVLREVMGGKVRAEDNDKAIFVDERTLAEFLEAHSNIPVSAAHARWLAYLLWLEARNLSLQVARSEQGLQCTLIDQMTSISPERLATWVEYFS